jgi:hypothetical protein
LLAGALTVGATGAMAAGENRPFDPARDDLSYNVTADTVTVTGEVTSIQGMKFLILGEDNRIVGVNMAELPYNPTDDSLYEPAIAKGDTVSIRGDISTLAENEVLAREVLSVRKSWQDRPVLGQRLETDEDFNAIMPAAGDEPMKRDRFN